MAPTPDEFSAPGSSDYDSSTQTVGDGTWDFTKNTFLLPNLLGNNFDTMRYNGMGNRFSTLKQYHTIIIAHGVLAALVFLFLIPSAIMIVRFHTGRPGYAVKYHARFQIISALLLVVVFILGFMAVGPNRSLTNPHHAIGLTIFVLFILQFLGGALIHKIQKAHSLRVTIHQWSGRALALLGIAQVPLGLTLYGSPAWLFILYSVWMAFLFLLYFILNFRSGSRRQLLREGPPQSEAGHTRVTETEYFASEQPDPEHKSNKWKWLGPLAAGGAGWWWLKNRRKNKDDNRSMSSRSRSPSYRSRGPEVLPSRRGSASYYDSEKYTEMSPQRKSSGGGLMKGLAGAAAAVGAGKLFGNFMDKRKDRAREDEYSAVSTETPRRHRPGRMPPHSDYSSELTEDTRGDPGATSLLSPGGNPSAMAGALSAADSRMGPRPAQARRGGRRRSFDDSEYSSYVSPSRRQPEVEERAGGGVAKGLLAGLGLGWIGKKMADRKAKKEEQRRMEEEDDMRSGLTDSRFTGDGYPSPTRKPSRRPTVRRSTGYPPPAGTQTEMTESSFVSDPPAGAGYAAPLAAGAAAGAAGRSRTRRQSVYDDPYTDAESSFVSDAPPQRRNSSRRRRAGEAASAAAAARASELAADQERDRERYSSPHSSQPLSVKLKVHDDRDRNVTLRRLTEEEARAARGSKSRSRADSESSMSGLDSPSHGRSRYRRESSQRRAESAAERRAEAEADKLSGLPPPNPAFAKGRRTGNKDSAYYSGGAAPQAGPSGASAAAGQTVSSLGSLASPDSHGTWSQMSPSPSGPDKAPSGSVAADRRERRRLERRRASSSRPTGTDMFD